MIDLYASLVILAAMFLRTVTGFGSALIAIPLLALLYSAKFAIPFIMLYECLIDLMILGKDSLRIRRELKDAWPLLIFGLIGVPLGAEILVLSDEWLLKVLMGIALVFFSFLLLFNWSFKLKRDKTVSAAFGLLGGFLCGSIGMPGPPMALLLGGQGFEKAAFRRLMVIFLTVIDFSTFFYFILIGLIDFAMLLQSLKLLPALIIGFLAGRSVFGRIDEANFRRLTLTITLISGILLLFSTL
jgi:uncharacterized protein